MQDTFFPGSDEDLGWVVTNHEDSEEGKNTEYCTQIVKTEELTICSISYLHGVHQTAHRGGTMPICLENMPFFAGNMPYYAGNMHTYADNIPIPARNAPYLRRVYAHPCRIHGSCITYEQAVFSTFLTPAGVLD